MYITIRSIKRTLGKHIEVMDLYLGIPMLLCFLIMFGFTNFRIGAVIFLAICSFLMIPVSFSKKNRMYKALLMCIKYILKNKQYIYFK